MAALLRDIYAATCSAAGDDPCASIIQQLWDEEAIQSQGRDLAITVTALETTSALTHLLHACAQYCARNCAYHRAVLKSLDLHTITCCQQLWALLQILQLGQLETLCVRGVYQEHSQPQFDAMWCNVVNHMGWINGQPRQALVPYAAQTYLQAAPPDLVDAIASAASSALPRRTTQLSHIALVDCWVPSAAAPALAAWLQSRLAASAADMRTLAMCQCDMLAETLTLLIRAAADAAVPAAVHLHAPDVRATLSAAAAAAVQTRLLLCSVPLDAGIVDHRPTLRNVLQWLVTAEFQWASSMLAATWEAGARVGSEHLRAGLWKQLLWWAQPVHCERTVGSASPPRACYTAVWAASLEAAAADAQPDAQQVLQRVVSEAYARPAVWAKVRAVLLLCAAMRRAGALLEQVCLQPGAWQATQASLPKPLACQGALAYVALQVQQHIHAAIAALRAVAHGSAESAAQCVELLLGQTLGSRRACESRLMAWLDTLLGSPLMLEEHAQHSPWSAMPVSSCSIRQLVSEAACSPHADTSLSPLSSPAPRVESWVPLTTSATSHAPASPPASPAVQSHGPRKLDLSATSPVTPSRGRGIPGNGRGAHASPPAAPRLGMHWQFATV